MSLGIKPALLDLVVDRAAVEQVQGLRERRLHLDLARAGGLAGGPAEGLEEIGRPRAVGDLHGPGPDRQAVELVLGVGDGADRVEQVLGLDPADQGMGEVPLVARVALVALGRCADRSASCRCRGPAP